MSDTSETPPESPQASTPASPPAPATTQLQPQPDVVVDLMLWKRKQLNILILLGATAVWVVMEIYQFNFITLFSWIAMAFIVCFFFWGNIHRLLKKEAPDLSELEISEETTKVAADLIRDRIEEGIQMMFHVSAEREWFVFAGVVAFLYLLSMVARQTDLLTLCYIGVLGGLTVPVIYVKNEDKLGDLGGKLRMKSQRLYSVIEEKLQKVKNKITGKQKEVKEKKVE